MHDTLQKLAMWCKSWSTLSSTHLTFWKGVVPFNKAFSLFHNLIFLFYVLILHPTPLLFVDEHLGIPKNVHMSNVIKLHLHNYKMGIKKYNWDFVDVVVDNLRYQYNKQKSYACFSHYFHY